mmetsp:Transcript_47986/g.71476  ORF Transcript_47986/g.71476 Transcript_47986/m.71476 type:complete len:282 (-) Transcript_47986:112-957(-)
MMIFSSLILTSVLLMIHLGFASSSEEAGLQMMISEVDDNKNAAEVQHSTKKRELTWGPWRPACKERFQDLTKSVNRASCYGFCERIDYDDPYIMYADHGYTAKWQCKADCNAKKREEFQECVSTYCSEDPAAAPASYTDEENELCSQCPCCANDEDFKKAALRPTLCNYNQFEDCDSTYSYCEYGDAYTSWTCDGAIASITSTDFFGYSHSRLECRSGARFQGETIELQSRDGADDDLRLPMPAGGADDYRACEALFDKAKCVPCAPESFNDAYCESFLAG